MWQIVAATERLFRRLPIACRQARELCTEFRYPSVWQDRVDVPVSFGWRDIDGLRYAFRRVYKGADRFGRPGVFAAHVLVDRPERLTAEDLLAGAQSPSWWSGEPLPAGSPWLPAVSLDGFDPPEEGTVTEPCADDDVTTAVLTAVLAHRGRPVLLALDAALVVGALRRVARLLPNALEDLSVSTYEPSITRANYAVAATTSPDDVSLAIPVEILLNDAGVALARSVSRLVLAESARSPSYIVPAWAAARGARPSPRTTFLRVCNAFLALRRAADPPLADLLPALCYPATASELLDDVRARTTVARALAAGDAPTVEALRVLRGSLDTETWVSISELTARAATTTRGLAAAWRLLHSGPADGVEAFVAELMRLATSDTTAVKRWPADLIPYACGRRDLRGSPALQAALVRAGAPNLLQFAHSPIMPADMWARMLEEAVRSGVVDAASVASTVAANGDLASATGESASGATLQKLLDALPATVAVHPLSRWALSVRPDALVGLAIGVAQRLGDKDAWRAAAAISGCLHADVPARWPKLRDQVLRRRLRYELSDHCAARRPLLDVVRADPEPDGRAWREYLRLVGGLPDSAPQNRGRTLADSIAMLGEPHRELAGRYALHQAVTHATSIDDVAVTAAVLVPLFGDDWAQAAELVLRGGLRATLASHRPESGLAALAYVALYLVEPGVVRRLKRTGELARRPAQDVAIHLYTALMRCERDLERHWQAWAVDRPRAEKWLRGLRLG